MRRGRKIAKVAMARKLAIELYWMWGRGWDYDQMQRLGSHAGTPGNPQGVQLITAKCLVSRSPPRREVRSSNHDRGCDRRDGWVGLSCLTRRFQNRTTTLSSPVKNARLHTSIRRRSDAGCHSTSAEFHHPWAGWVLIVRRNSPTEEAFTAEQTPR